MTSTFFRKSLVGENKAYKKGLLIGFLFGCIFTGLIWNFNNAFASGSFFTDDFETYDVGDLGGQGYWENYSDCYSWHVTTSTSESGLRSITIPTTSYCHANLKNGVGQATTTSGVLSFKFKCVEDTPYCQLYFYLQKGVDRYTANASPFIRINPAQSGEIQIVGKNTISEERVAYSFPFGNWNEIKIEYDYIQHRARANLNNGVWSGYVELPTELLFANAIYIVGAAYEVDGIHLDHLYTQAEFVPTCDYGGGCAFCNSSTTCQFHNCFWQNNYCWFNQPVTTTDFYFYYNDNSGYATPTNLVIGLYNFSKPFIENVGGFLVSFQEIFDIGKAGLYGASIGNAIVTARGYLAIINDFVSGFPLSQIFIFYVLVIVVVGVLKIVKFCIGLIKPV